MCKLFVREPSHRRKLGTGYCGSDRRTDAVAAHADLRSLGHGLQVLDAEVIVEDAAVDDVMRQEPLRMVEFARGQHAHTVSVAERPFFPGVCRV